MINLSEINVCAVCGTLYHKGNQKCPVCQLKKKVDSLEAILLYHGLMKQ